VGFDRPVHTLTNPQKSGGVPVANKGTHTTQGGGGGWGIGTTTETLRGKDHTRTGSKVRYLHRRQKLQVGWSGRARGINVLGDNTGLVTGGERGMDKAQTQKPNPRPLPTHPQLDGLLMCLFVFFYFFNWCCFNTGRKWGARRKHKIWKGNIC